jgi:hypothetical protein
MMTIKAKRGPACVLSHAANRRGDRPRR